MGFLPMTPGLLTTIRNRCNIIYTGLIKIFDRMFVQFADGHPTKYFNIKIKWLNKNLKFLHHTPIHILQLRMAVSHMAADLAV